ncbi:centriolar satellite-associated tubulin polyglutamylase complex regulator 1 isoform X2 [Cololabis saira]|uniref:centriolar satellite-associated tubulin polyglutamylase complex regulator 1 isoform X2 n=1 Tax=Cololabis saira TaxID=129043 RepID=UPI002AD2B4E1|nr:centriolar satellite-associated tubulin polyglutamylase complex regulator 1 isoform X2 [Cololabis saira]
MNRLSAAVPAEQYLADSHVLFYLSDAVTQLLEHKEEYTQFGLIRYFAEYFSSVKNSNHVLFREYNYIQATPHNKASFIRVFWRCFRQIGKSGDSLSVLEYRSLLQLLCPDFPVEVVQSAARIVLMDDTTDCLMSFSDFIYAFQLQFYYKEFLESVLGIYQDLLAGKSPNTVFVPTSASVEQMLPLAAEENEKEEPQQDEVEASTLAQCVETLCDRFKHRIAQISVSPGSNSSGSAVGALKEVPRRASPRRNIHHRRRMEVESDGSNEETDSSEN